MRGNGSSASESVAAPHRRKTPMARVKRGSKRRARRKKYLRRAKGFFLTKSKLYQSAQEAVNRAERFSFRDRRVKKRQFRTLWIQRIGAAARTAGMSYSQLMHGLKAAGIEIDRKVLADLAVKDAGGFTQLIERAKAAGAKTKA
jgi:large subunit ribosomal protein L20